MAYDCQDYEKVIGYENEYATKIIEEEIDI